MMIFLPMLKDFINVTHVRSFLKPNKKHHRMHFGRTRSHHTQRNLNQRLLFSNFLLEKDVHKTLEKVIASVLMTDDARNSAVDTTSTSTPTTSTTVKVKTNRKRLWSHDGWMQSETEIADDGVASQHRKLFKKNGRSIKHDKLFKRLYEQFQNARSKGMKVSFSWMYTEACIISNELDPNTKHLSKSVLVSFIRKYNIKLRRVQRKKRVDKTNFAPQIMKWHCTLREGRTRITFQRRNENITRVGNPGAGLENHQCSLQFAFSPVDDKLRISIIFRGTGKRVSDGLP